jgi:hypothetical protein
VRAAHNYVGNVDATQQLFLKTDDNQYNIFNAPKGIVAQSTHGSPDIHSSF